MYKKILDTLCYGKFQNTFITFYVTYIVYYILVLLLLSESPAMFEEKSVFDTFSDILVLIKLRKTFTNYLKEIFHMVACDGQVQFSIP